MKLRLLEFSGIGPYPNAHSIDFSAFEASGLFLLQGPTGAGKSTIIDAVTFALYGDVARQKDSDKSRLRSTYCQDHQISEVSLIFEVPSGIFRVIRRPKYQRSDKKSPEKERALLERVAEKDDGTWVPVAAISQAIQEVNREITAAIGLNKDQFLQTVILPQGKFSRFLTSTSKEREEILQDVFGTRIFERLQNDLKTEATLRKSTRETAWQAFLSAADSLRSLLPEDSLSPTDDSDTSTPESGVDYRPLADSLEELLAPLTPALHAAQTDAALADQAIEPAKAEENQARSALDNAKQLAALIDEKTAAETTLVNLTSRTEEIDNLRTRVEFAKKVAPIRTANRRLTVAAESLDTAEQQMHSAVVLAATTPQPLPSPTLQSPTTPDQAHSLRQQLTSLSEQALEVVTTLAGLIPQRDALEHSKTQFQALDTEEKDLLTQRDSLRRTIEAAPDALATQRRILADKETCAATIPALDVEIAALETRIAAAAKADTLRGNLEDLSLRLGQAKREASVARQAASAAHELWLADTARVLSETLKEGLACPVCGSATHPAPAHQRGDSPGEEEVMTREDVAAFDAASRKADTQFDQARTAHSDAIRMITVLNEQAKGDSASLALARNEAASRLDAAHQARTEAANLRETIAAAETELEQIRTSSTRIETELASLRSRRGALEEDISRREQSLSNHDLHTLIPQADSHRDKLNAWRNLCAQAIAAIDHWEDTYSEHHYASIALTGALEDAGFSAEPHDLDHLLASSLDPAAQQRAETTLHTYDQEIAGVRATLASPRLKDIDMTVSPDIEGAAARHAAADDSVKTLTAQAGAAHSRLEFANRAYGAARARAKDYLDARASAAPAVRLANLALASSSENLSQTPLGSWVLTSRLDDVLAAANPRLLAISDGRYELRRSHDDGTASRKSGLGLAIIDHDVEEERATRTLSGGETFYCSLSLALGLADVVTAEAGGVELRTMFIDEGFGSLDANKLDTVMAQLQALRDHGRTIGVISHVDEMARRIPDQIQVRWAPGVGSTVKVRS
ncbi:MAG: SMC family ATPase [Actinomycetaceae bacterium]|nr:SMC family ATPase [Actinomycetaceae bacterium]